MFEFHGWFTVSPSSSDYESHELLNLQVEIDKMILTLEGKIPILGSKVQNGTYFVWLAGMRNHAASTAIVTFDFIKFIAETAPGSYGLLYIRDDEEPTDNSNRFIVWRMAKGRIERFEDDFLSPCVPIIEDP